MNFRFPCFLSSLLVTGAICIACADSEPSPTLTPDAATPEDSGDDETAAFLDAGRAYGCTEEEFAANDRTADSAERVLHASSTQQAIQFNPHCMRIRVAQTVAWDGDLADHPLTIQLSSSAVGVVGEPDGSPDYLSITARGAGVIEFSCTNHPRIEFGAIEVVP